MRNFTGFLVALFLSLDLGMAMESGNYWVKCISFDSFDSPESQGGADGCSSGGHQTSKAITF